MSRSGARDRLLDAAETRARSGGYNAFSFRDLASDVNIKSSSVHHHFPTKADLAVALARRYAERVRDHLGPPENLSPDAAVARLTGVFRNALIVEDRMCLCGLFGAERDALPSAVDAEVAGFFRMLLEYLGIAFGQKHAGPGPAAVVAVLEGALMVARALRDPALFEVAVAGLGAGSTAAGSRP